MAFPFRRSFSGGMVTVSAGVADMPDADRTELLKLVREFDQFERGDDPYREHDFGAIELGGERHFWKIDFYDAERHHGSENPADPAQTTAS